MPDLKLITQRLHARYALITDDAEARGFLLAVGTLGMTLMETDPRVDVQRLVAETQGPLLKPCRSPYCECTVGHCTHPGCYDARGEPL